MSNAFPIDPTGRPPAPGSPAAAPRRAAQPGFAGALQAAVGNSPGVRFSGHALERLERRGIAPDPATLARLNDGVSKAAAKGARDALVLVDSTAYVVSIKHRTVITAVGAAQMRDRVFTNIDSAVIN